MTYHTNKKVYHDYFVDETITAGIVLLGTEVKSVISSNCNLQGAWIDIDKNEAWLIGSFIGQYSVSSKYNPHDEKRKRKLLLTKKQLRDLQSVIDIKGKTLVPLTFENVNNKIKVCVCVCRGKKNYDKRDSDKEKTVKKQIQALNYLK